MSTIQRLLKIVFRFSRWEYLVKEQFQNVSANTNKQSNKMAYRQQKAKLANVRESHKASNDLQNEPAYSLTNQNTQVDKKSPSKQSNKMTYRQKKAKLANVRESHKASNDLQNEPAYSLTNQNTQVDKKSPSKQSNKMTYRQRKAKFANEQQSHKASNDLQNELAYSLTNQNTRVDKKSLSKDGKKERKREKKSSKKAKKSMLNTHKLQKSLASLARQQSVKEPKINLPYNTQKQQLSHISIMKTTNDHPQDTRQSQGRWNQQLQIKQSAGQSKQQSETKSSLSKNAYSSVADILIKARQRGLNIIAQDQGRVKRAIEEKDKYNAERMQVDVNFQKQAMKKDSVQDQTLDGPSSVISQEKLDSGQSKMKIDSKKQGSPLFQVNSSVKQNKKRKRLNLLVLSKSKERIKMRSYSRLDKSFMKVIGEQNIVQGQKWSGHPPNQIQFPSHSQERVYEQKKVHQYERVHQEKRGQSGSEMRNVAKQAGYEQAVANQNANDLHEQQSADKATAVVADIQINQKKSIEQSQECRKTIKYTQSRVESRKQSIKLKLKLLETLRTSHAPQIAPANRMENQRDPSIINVAKPGEDLTQINTIVPQRKMPQKNQISDFSQRRNSQVNSLPSKEQFIQKETLTPIIKKQTLSVASSLISARKNLTERAALVKADQPSKDSFPIPNQQFHERIESIHNQGDTEDSDIWKSDADEFSQKWVGVDPQQEAEIFKTIKSSSHMLYSKQQSALQVHSSKKMFNQAGTSARKEEISQKPRFKCWSSSSQKDIDLNQQDEPLWFNQELEIQESDSFNKIATKRFNEERKFESIKMLISRMYTDEWHEGLQWQVNIRKNWKLEEEMTIQESIERPLEITRINQCFSEFTTMMPYVTRVTHFPSNWSIDRLENVLDPSKTKIHQIFKKKSGDVFIDFHSISHMKDCLRDCNMNFKSVESNLYRIILHNFEISDENDEVNQQMGVEIKFFDTSINVKQLQSLASEHGELLQIIEDYAEHELTAVFYFENSVAAQSFQAKMNQTQFGQQVLKAKFIADSLEKLLELSAKEDDENEGQMFDQE